MQKLRAKFKKQGKIGFADRVNESSMKTSQIMNKLMGISGSF